MNLNNGDVQSKAIYTEDGIANAIYSGEKSYGGSSIYHTKGEKTDGR